MIITDLYQTRINATDYTLAHNGETTLTINLKDFNGSNVTGKQINNITCDKGVFTQITDKTRTNSSLNNVKTINGITNSNGEILLKFKATDWGLCTISCNNMKLQIFVNGWEEITPLTTSGGFEVSNSALQLFVNGTLRLAVLKSKNTSAIFKSGDVSYANLIPTEYRPTVQVIGKTVYKNGRLLVDGSGNVYYHELDSVSTTGKNGSGTLMWQY